MFAGANKVNNLIGIVDYNRQQIDGSVDEVLPLGDLKAKWESFGWEIWEADGNNYEEIKNTLLRAKGLESNDKPVCILMRTIMGKGIDFMENNHKWHGSPPNTEQMENALLQLSDALRDY